MTGHRPFSDLMKDWTPERRAANEARRAEMMAELASLERLREELGISEEEHGHATARYFQNWCASPI